MLTPADEGQNAKIAGGRNLAGQRALASCHIECFVEYRRGRA